MGGDSSYVNWYCYLCHERSNSTVYCRKSYLPPNTVPRSFKGEESRGERSLSPPERGACPGHFARVQTGHASSCSARPSSCPGFRVDGESRETCLGLFGVAMARISLL